MKLRRAGRARARLVLMAVTTIGLVGPVGAVSAEAQRRWQWPLHPRPAVARAFEPPVESWSAGHRGVDLRGTPLQPVRAVGTGRVTYAGVIAGRGVVVVHHGSLRSTYQPVTAAVHVDQTVAAGEVVGLLQAVGSHCAPQACLHLGVRRGDIYVDPLTILGPQRVVLKPLDGSSQATDPAGWLLRPDADGAANEGPRLLGEPLVPPNPTGAWPSGAEPRHLGRAPGGLSSTRAALRSVQSGVANAVARVVASLLTALRGI